MPKFRDPSEIYERTRPAEGPSSPPPETNHGQQPDELSGLLQDQTCPTLSPPRGEAPNLRIENTPSPSSSSSSGLSSDLDSVISESTNQRIAELQGAIEEEVTNIATSIDCGTLLDDDPHVLGQWVHSERSDVQVLKGILSDLQERGPTSEYFEEALKAWASQFINNAGAPFEPCEILPFTNLSLFLLLTLGIFVLLIWLFWLRK